VPLVVKAFVRELERRKRCQESSAEYVHYSGRASNKMGCPAIS
jgi:hypothetical protein